MKNFLEKNSNKIEFMFLPAYSPDLNPIERVWWFMRKKISHNRHTNTLDDRIKQFWKMFSKYQKPNEEIVEICNIKFSV